MSSLSRLLCRTFSTSLSKSPQLNPSNSYSNELYKERDLKTLVQKFKEFSESYQFRTKTGTYTTTVRRLATAKRFKWIEEILEDQKKYPDISKEGFSIRLITLYGRSGMFHHASKVFDEMPERNCTRTVKSFNALLAACVNSKRFDKVDGFFRELPEKLLVKPDVVSYNTLIKALCEMGSLDSAVLMFDEIEKNWLEPDLITFNTLMDTLYGNGRFLDGEKFWGKMLEKGLVPDIRSYNAKLVGLASEKKMAEAVELVGEMSGKEVKPDVFSFNALIIGYCNEGNIEEAKKWYAELVKSKLAPHKTIFTELIPFACKMTDFDWAIELCKEIFLHKFLVDETLLQLVVDGLVKESRTEEAKKILEMGKSNNYRRYSLKMPSNE